VTDLMVRPGLINLDFADVRAVMDEMGKAMMGTGEAEGEDRAIQAAEKAIANPLLDEISLRGARGVLINITGAHDLTLFELDEAANRIREEVDPNANIIVGSTLDTSMEGMMRVSVVATGIDASEVQQDIPVPRRRLAEPLHPEPVAPVAAAAAPAAAAAAAAAPAPIAAQPVPAPEPHAEEPSFFDSHFETPVADDAAVSAEAEAALEEALGGIDTGLPDPVYHPMHEAAEPASEFVAPRPRQAGTPTPEAMERLKVAVSKMPRAEEPAGEEAASAEKPRFGINSLINRMTGHGAAAEAAPRPMPEARRAPPVESPAQSADMDEDQERIEIPAFLRRQAN